MSTSYHVKAYRDFDVEFSNMMEIKLYCESKKVSYPKEVSDYFGKFVAYKEDWIKDEMLLIDIKDCTTDYSEVGIRGFDVDVKKLPKEVKTIRFYASY